MKRMRERDAPAPPGYKDVVLRLPDTSSPAFQAECRRQARLLRDDPAEADHAAWAAAAAAVLDLDT
ncbi:antitoxin MazE-like protein [Chthonobacter rhizosphaerae]|uniref:antitoxin MazE-like protein n=1 Tax=Chthonobacter rhizosphaerae TaxID=2735553 RepID=UPI001AEED8CB|nr:antitoxin MazE-like protein [Chthonobacter rhizosphaerae]